jgi:hypothetical protein
MTATPSPDRRDFVDRLVIKALGASELPMPRLPSLFESPQTYFAADTDLVEMDDEATAPQPVADTSLVRLARSPLPTPSPQPPALVPHTAGAQPGEETRAHRDVTLPLHDQPAARSAAGGPAVSHLPAIATPAPRTRFRLTRVDEVVHPAHPLGRRPSAIASDDGTLTPAIHVRNVVEHHRRMDHRMASPSVDEQLQGVLVPRASGVVPPPERIYSGQPGRASARELAANNGTVAGDVAVNVTIGRIEVKATRAAASDRQGTKVRGPQPMPLDEYLGQRGAR